MILLVDLCYEKESLSQYEFVFPIADIVKRAEFRYDIVHHSEMNGLESEKYDKIILCGTALKDDVYLENVSAFSWIKECRQPLLGICAGMQVIGSVFGGRVIAQPSIGLKKIDIVKETPLLGETRRIEGYHLHNYGVTLPQGFEQIAGSVDQVEAFWHEERFVYGITFHPEVRNKWIVDRFVKLG